MRWSPAWTAIVAAVLSASAAAQQRGGAGDLTDLLARIGARVEQYYARARTIVCIETVVLQPLAHDLTANGRARTARLRVARRMGAALRGRPVPRSKPEASAESAASSAGSSPIDGRPPRPQDKPGCMDPRAVSPEPLAMLLPGPERGVRICLGRDGRDRRSSQRETRLPADRERPAGDRMARGLRQRRVARPIPRAGLD